ncbi:uncharacterized protein LOC125658468 [Ostrea edulis]|uniref:uncharacterized protein LOC125658468 n=1 Tax=Ostrea edulis TaxID=37623 RepID=UPI0024AEF4D4|nr:uncharacterized protein LOC125658468 [Ostrea edulis]
MMKSPLTLLALVVCLAESQTIAVSEIDDTNITDFTDNVDRQRGMDSVVLRQLLNQETLIRMSLVKNVHAMMKDMVSFKDMALSLQNEMADLKQTITDEMTKRVKDARVLKREIQKLKEMDRKLEERLVDQNQTDSSLREELEKTKSDQKGFEITVLANQEQLDRNVSERLSDINVHVRILSMSLIELQRHAQQIEKTVPELIEEKFQVVSQMMSNVSTSLLEDSNGTLSEIKADLSDTQQIQLKLSSAVLSLEWFRNNISSGGSDSKKGIGFTAGTVSDNRYWNSGKLVFSSVLYNEGNGYNPLTGVFTSPTQGFFVFYVTINAYGSTTVYVDIVQNSVSKVRALAYGSTSHQTGTNMVVLNLRDGDKVWVQFHSGQGYHTNSIPITTFTGFMI